MEKVQKRPVALNKEAVKKIAEKGYKLMMVGTPDLTYKGFVDYFKNF